MLKQNAKLISTTNPSMKKYVNTIGNLCFSSKNQGYFYTYSSMEYSFRTSIIVSYELIENEIILKTLNSIYKFEIFEEIEMSQIVKLSDSRLQVFEYLKNIKSKKFTCALDGGFLRGLISTVTFEKSITRVEALKLLEKNIIKDDCENTAISNILFPVDKEGYVANLKLDIIDNQKYISKKEFERANLLECLEDLVPKRKEYIFNDNVYIDYDDAEKIFDY